ncbi:hypothetical protein BOX15_Mlig001888g1 [Macrostomum lignano]|uniref:Kelch domain-containing protein n=2 Tax=Macrostomum lignano TaxID=282301 RepID=A0A1I8J5G1_9PLAT|nr:hypothetical protein BOX15_Mlig001888g1 [Macrostomum lignano]
MQRQSNLHRHPQMFVKHRVQSQDVLGRCQGDGVADGEPVGAWPHARSGHRLLAGAHNLWLIGGFHPEENDAGGLLFEEVWQYNIASGQWRRLVTTGDMPAELASHAALLDPPYLLVHGGTATPFGIRRSRRLHRLCLRTLHWSEVPLTHIGGPDGRPRKVYGHSFTLVKRPDGNRVIYQFGGTTGHVYTNSVHALDMNTWQWCHFDPHSPLPAAALDDADELEANATNGYPPSPRYRHETVYWRGCLLVVGGGTSVSVCGLDRLSMFCPESRTWSRMLTHGAFNNGVPQARRCHSCLLHGDWLMLSGGCTQNNIPLGDVWFLHLPTAVWHRSAYRLPQPTYFHASAVTPAGQAFIFGGVVTTRRDESPSRSDALYSCWFPGAPGRLESLCLRLVVPRAVAWLRRCSLTIQCQSLRLRLMELGVQPDLILNSLAQPVFSLPPPPPTPEADPSVAWQRLQEQRPSPPA